MIMRKVRAVFFLSPKLQRVWLEKGLWMIPPIATPSTEEMPILYSLPWVAQSYSRADGV